MRVTYLLAVLCAGALQLPAALRSQEHTVVRPRVEEIDRARRGGAEKKQVDKADKWEKKRVTERTKQFNAAAKADAKLRGAKVDRERKDRDLKDVRRRTVEKADKWDKNQITKKFNDAANPPPPPPNNNGGGGKSGGNPPPSGPKGPKGPKGP